MEFIEVLKERSLLLFWFSTINLLAAIIFLILSYLIPVEFGGTNAWYKPLKFALSTAILCYSLTWYLGYLPKDSVNLFVSWVIVITLGFEVVYIAWQAAKGQASHFNLSTPFYSFMFSLMAIAATVATIAIGYFGLRFFANSFPELPNYYLWALRCGFVIFVIFSFEGFLMGGRLAHTVGESDGGIGIPFLNWSTTAGDLRIAHFIGMHALQVLPILSYYLLKDVKLTMVLSVCYLLLAVFVLVQALGGNSLFKI
ncbi:MAG: hypothetical protein AAFQ94_12350 [Bacteroidota bacterium]